MTYSLPEEAERYWRLGYKSQMNGRIDEAINLYRRSISLYPTAEAYTFLGWSYSFKGNLEEAIAECERAIEVDPDFGNPYNDIGAYMMKMGKYEESITWLERACHAPRYESRHFPHYNLGRALERLGDVLGAIAEYEEAARLEPRYNAAHKAAERLRAWMN